MVIGNLKHQTSNFKLQTSNYPLLFFPQCDRPVYIRQTYFLPVLEIVGILFKQQSVFANGNHVAIFKAALPVNGSTVDLYSVGAVLVFDEERVPLPVYLGMKTGNCRVINVDIVGRIPSDPEGFLSNMHFTHGLVLEHHDELGQRITSGELISNLRSQKFLCTCAHVHWCTNLLHSSASCILRAAPFLDNRN